MSKPVLHLLGIPHTITRPEYSHCAYTNKVRTFAPMMRALEYHVIHYGVGGAISGANEQIDLLSEEEFHALMGGKKDMRSPGWFVGDVADVRHPWYRTFNQRLIPQLKAQVDPDNDIVCVPFGLAHEDTINALPKLRYVETGIGYPKSFAEFRVFESYAWMHRVLGAENKDKPEDLGRDYWWVVPNPYDLVQWLYPADDERAQDYVLYLGRLHQAKGLHIVYEMAKHRPDLHFLCVGQGDPSPWQRPALHNLEFRPPVVGDERRELFAKALCTVCLTRYIEPFAQVHIESLIMGVPVITSNFGVFTETVQNGINGYRTHTLGDALAALENIEKGEVLDQRNIAAQTRQEYSTRTVGPQYDNVFQQIMDLKGEGYYTLRSPLGSITKAKRAPTGSASVASRAVDIVVDPKAWELAQTWEREWWRHKERWALEEEKQLFYARYMRMPITLSFPGKIIVDFGCGPVSLLFRSTDWQEAVGIDPLNYDDEKRYNEAGIRRFYCRAEEAEVESAAHEVWCYNVLQHVLDPRLALDRMKAACASNGVIRLFEWLHTPVSDGHLHTLTEALFAEAFPESSWDRRVWEMGTLSTPQLHGDYFTAILAPRIKGLVLPSKIHISLGGKK